MPESKPKLERALGLRDLILFNVAAVVGIRWLAAAAHTGPASLTLWLLAAVFFFVPSALAVARLASRFPEEGGLYVWAREGFGDWHGFLCGWCYWLSNLFYFPNLLLAGVAMAGSALGFGENQIWTVAISLAILWATLVANLVGVAVGKWTSNVGGLATYAAGALIILFGLWVWFRGGAATPLELSPRWDLDKLNFWSQIAFAFGGLELGAVMGGEIRDPGRTIPRAAWAAGLAIAGFYIAGTWALLVLIPADRISEMTGLVQAGTAAGTRLGIPAVSLVLIALILAGVAGQLGAWLSGSARVPFVIGLDRYLPPIFARLHPRWRTPHVTILAQGVVCTAALLAFEAGQSLRTGYQLLVDMTVISYFIPFLYLFAAAWKYGARWSAWSGLLVTAAAIAVSVVPPEHARPVWLFELKLAGGCAVLIAAGKIAFQAAITRNDSTLRGRQTVRRQDSL